VNLLIDTPPETVETLIGYPPPRHLKHRPLVMVPYEPFDGPYIGATDAKYLSIGRAQWRDDGNDPDALSAKVWRYVEGKWSRMSEELPLHRVVDLCLLMTCCLFSPPDRGAVELPAGTFEGQRQPMDANLLEAYPDGFDGSPQEERIKARLRVLRDLLNSLPL